MFASQLKKWVMLICVVLLVLFAVRTTDEALAGKEQLKLWTFLDPEGPSARGQALKKMMEIFETRNPNVSITVEVVSWAQLSMKYMMAYEAGNEPDISWVEISYQWPIMEQGSAEDLMKWISKEWSAEDRNDFPQALWEVGLEDNKKYFLTTYHMSHALGYRKSLFAEAGIDPNNMRSWDEFIDAARKLVVDNDGKHPGEKGFNENNVKRWGVGFARTMKQHDLPLERIMRSMGVPLLDLDTYKANWTREEGIKAMTLCVDLITKYKIESIRDLTYNNEEQVNNFSAGLFSIGVVGSQKYRDIRRKAAYDPDDIALMRWPTFDGRKIGAPADTWGWAIVMSNHSRNKEEAWRFLDLYESKEGDLINVKIGGQLPCRGSTVTDPYFDSPEAAYLKWYIEYMKDTSYMQQTPVVMPSDDLIIAFHDIVIKGVPVEQALQSVAERYNKKLEEAR